MKELIILYLGKPNYGGWVSFTEHLYAGFMDAGVRPIVLKIGNNTERKLRSFSGKVAYLNVSLKDAIRECSNRTTLVVCLDKHHLEAAKTLASCIDGIVIHDHTEFKNLGVLPALPLVFAIRRQVCKHLKRLGVSAQYIPHPYQPFDIDIGISPAVNAVAWSRVDWDKNTHMIAEANSLLPEARRCEIWGAENTLYTFHKILTPFPGYKQSYRGKFPKATGAGVMIAARGRYAIDLSVISGDGGGTQYTFLEAWNARRPLVIHGKWCLGENDSMKPNINCLAVNTATELVDVLSTNDHGLDLEIGYQEMLTVHNPKKIATAYLQHLTESSKGARKSLCDV